MNLKKIFSHYEEIREHISANRQEMKEKEEENRQAQEAIEALKKDMAAYLEQHPDKTLYQICMEEFGVIDNRYFVLYNLKS